MAWHNKQRVKIKDIPDLLERGFENAKSKLANNGKIKSFKTTGEHRRFRQEDLDAYMGVEKEKQEKLTVIYTSATDKERYEAKTEIERRLEAGDRAIQACREITKMEIPE